MLRLAHFIPALLLAARLVLSGPDNAGKEFIIAFMDNEEAQKHQFSCIPLDVYVSTPMSSRVFVNVSAPRSKLMPTAINFNITRGEVKHLELNCNLRSFNTSFGSKGILVQATDEVIVYGINRQTKCTDGFLALPTDVLGTKYYTASYSDKVKRDYFTNILVVVTEDQSQVGIRLANASNLSLTYKSHTYRGRDWINLTMNRYDTFQLESKADLTGSLVESNKPVAVLSGNKKSSVHLDGKTGGVDHLSEQIPPTATWGKTFVTVPIPKRSAKQIFKLISSHDNTTINITWCERNVTTYFLNEGEFKQHAIPFNCYSYITSSKPVLVMQFIHSRATYRESDPAMFFVPPAEQYAADYSISLPKATSGPFDNFFLVVLKDADKTGLLIDGTPITSTELQQFHKISGTNLAGGYISIGKDTKVHTVKHSSQISVFGAVAYGGADRESYAFPVGLRLAPINEVCHPSTMSVADGLDNDCDGKIDEEICYSNTVDEDGDGFTNEDCAPLDPGVTTKIATAKPTTISKAHAKTMLTSTYSTTTVAMPTSKQLLKTHTSASISTANSKETTTAKTLYGQVQYVNANAKDAEIIRPLYEIPSTFKKVEVGILGTITIIVLGAGACCCRKIITFPSWRRNDVDEEDGKKFVRWKKSRPLPRPRRLKSKI